MPKTALLIVDVQNDFLPGGALPVADGDRVIHPISQLVQDVDLVVASRDWHPANHVSFTKVAGADRFPPHCVQETKGAKLHPKVSKIANYVVSKGTEVSKEAFSAFAGGTLRPARSLEKLLRDHQIERVVVVGLALDYCVHWTALDANALGFETIVPLDCTAALSEEGEQNALAAFERAGVTVVDHWSP